VKFCSGLESAGLESAGLESFGLETGVAIGV
jgi:hypothetical protein